MRSYRVYVIIFCFLLGGITCNSYSKTLLPAYFSDNMVIQRNSILTFPGKSEPNKDVVLQTGWNDKEYTAKADKNGVWSIKITTPDAGGPYRITVSDGDLLILNNVLVGDIWFCSGQSNMEMPVGGWGKVLNYEQEIKDANYPSVRLLQVKKATALIPSDDVDVNMGGWQECNSTTVPEFSAIAYFYAHRLWNDLGVPIGVIDCTWGGTPAEAWTSHSTLQHVDGYQRETAVMSQYSFDKKRLQQVYQQEMNDRYKMLADKDKGFVNSVPQWISSLQTGSDCFRMDLPGYWEYRGLENFDGIVWFQKEIDIPTDWQGKDIELSLGMIDDEDITYYNGVQIATGEGYMTPRKYIIPGHLVEGSKGLITIRVTDHTGEGGIHGEPENLFVKVDEKKIPISGTWSYKIGLSKDDFPQMPVSPESSSYPTVLYNKMVHPFTKFPIKGVIWYQGEANVDRADKYSNLFKALIMDWRNRWGQELPFYFVQLANFMDYKAVQPDSKWALLREAQAQALHLNNTGMAVAIDLGEAKDIHPKNKQAVANRLANLALSQTYRKDVSLKAPILIDYYISGDSLTLVFDSRLYSAADEHVKGFIITGPDNIYYSALATINGNEVILRSPFVRMPVTARYGWADNPEGSLKGLSGYPVAPFRTDR
ncbi:MAG: 9-O-acetylesterase [Prevotella sp.]|nr:9-O-acetylesterase [Prevotella sp.]